MVQRRARAGVVLFPGQLWPRFLAPAHHQPLSVGATVGALGVEVPQIQFLDAVLVGYWRAWRLVRQWIHGLRQFLGACGRFFTFRCEGLLGS